MNIVRRQPSNLPAVSNPMPVEWDPFRMMREFMRWDPFREIVPVLNVGGDAQRALYVPDVDVKETADAYIFKADVPGIKEKDLEIATTGNRITLTGKRDEERHEETATYYSSERSYGSFSRSFTLPDGTDVDRATAELKEGVLTISVPKKPGIQPKKIALGSPTSDKTKS
jgi:HSP20 family protein